VIEGESDERLLKDRHERFRQIICQRTQARPEAGTENESLRDHRLVLASTPAKNCAMAEETVWCGSSSQIKNLGLFVVAILACGIVFLIFALVWGNATPSVRAVSPHILWLAIVPIFIALARYLQTKSKVYELTTERLKTTEGVFSKVTDTLELYRVKDLETQQPFWSRMCGIENVRINTSDLSTPFVVIEAVPIVLGLGDKIRNAVENVRMQKRVREIDIE
jgi:uncharacterized membrane protein YdbT with pleckstrin-like domain